MKSSASEPGLSGGAAMDCNLTSSQSSHGSGAKSPANPASYTFCLSGFEDEEYEI